MKKIYALVCFALATSQPIMASEQIEDDLMGIERESTLRHRIGQWVETKIEPRVVAGIAITGGYWAFTRWANIYGQNPYPEDYFFENGSAYTKYVCLGCCCLVGVSKDVVKKLKERGQTVIRYMGKHEDINAHIPGGLDMKKDD